MAESVVPITKVHDLKVDFFQKFKLQTDRVISLGMCGEIVLAIPLRKPDMRCVVKKFTLLDDENKVRNKNIFHNEVQFMKSFNHPFLMKCVIAAQGPEYFAISMYYYERGTLLRCIRGLSIELIELCITQVACALRFMHKRNVVHLDVKLNNVFMDDNFNAILGDFGLAMELFPQQHTLARIQCGGTPSYFAPERIGVPGDKILDPYKLDSYCLGVVMWALVFEKKPTIGINHYLEARKNGELSSNIRCWLLKLLDRNPVARLTATEILTKVRPESAYRRIIDNC